MYGLMLAAAFLVCSFLSWIRTRKRGLPGENLIIIAAMVLLFALLGGELFFIFVTYSPKMILEIIRAGEWESLFGGIVFYGGLIGGVIGGFLGSIIARDDIRNYLDVVVPVLPLGHAIGRIGCFCAGCCFGWPTDSSIGVVYTEPVGGAPTGIKLLPVQLFESAVNLLIFAVLMIVSHKMVKKRDTADKIGPRYLTTFLYCIFYGIARFSLEFFRYDSIRGSAAGLSTSQWVSVGLFAAGLIGVVIYAVYRKRLAAAA